MNAEGMPSLWVHTVCVYSVRGLYKSAAAARCGSKIKFAAMWKDSLRPVRRDRMSTLCRLTATIHDNVVDDDRGRRVDGVGALNLRDSAMLVGPQLENRKPSVLSDQCCLSIQRYSGRSAAKRTMSATLPVNGSSASDQRSGLPSVVVDDTTNSQYKSANDPEGCSCRSRNSEEATLKGPSACSSASRGRARIKASRSEGPNWAPAFFRAFSTCRSVHP